MNFTFLPSNGFMYLSYYPWREAGIVHGFTDKGADFSSKGEGISLLSKAFEGRTVLSPVQVHGNEIWDLRVKDTLTQALNGTRVEADAIIATRGSFRGIIGVKTADCVPLLIIAPHECAVIHAGWRGLASGIIAATVKRLLSVESLTVLVGPCGGGGAYEVGPEVISKLGEDGICRLSDEPGRFLLSLQDTARVQVLKCAPSASVYLANRCTITESTFHSHRRDGEQSGRNFSFIMV